MVSSLIGRWIRLATALLVSAGLGVALPACGGGNGAASLVPQASVPAPAQAAGARAKRRGSLHLTIYLARKHRTHRAHYISPYTRSILFNIYDATHTYFLSSAEVDIVPGSSTCPQSGNVVTCSITILAPIGQDTFDITTYSRTGGGGDPLSGVSDFPFTVGNGGTLGVTLDGIPARIELRAASQPLLGGSVAHGFQIAGQPAVTFAVLVYDAAGNVIAGPGAPSLALVAASTNVKVTAGRQSNTFVLTPARYDPTPFALTASATPLGGEGYPLSVATTVHYFPLLYVANYGVSGPSYVTAYAQFDGTPLLTVSTGAQGLYGLCADASGNYYVSNAPLSSGSSASVTEYAAGSAKVLRTIPLVGVSEYGMTTDAAGNLYVSDLGNGSGGSLSVYPPKGTTPTTTITGLAQPFGVAVDASSNVYVADHSGNAVYVYAPGSTVPSATLTTGVSSPWQLAFDSGGNLFVANTGSKNVTEYAPPFFSTSAPVRTFTLAASSQPQSLALDTFDNLYVVYPGTNQVAEFAANGTTIRTIAGLSAPEYVAVGPQNEAYVTNFGAGSVPVYAAGSTVAPVRTYTAGMAFPYFVAIWP